jgi:molecular chaperone GrpE
LSSEEKGRLPAEESEKLLSTLKEKDEQLNRLVQQMKYLQADLENYKKRIDREVKEIEEFSTVRLTKKLLPVLDELELAIDSAEASRERNPILEGIRMVSKNLKATLEIEGLKRIEALGKPFNPDQHEALERVPGKNNKEDIVIEEIRAGYIFKGRVLRPTLVKVQVAAKTESQKSGEE